MPRTIPTLLATAALLLGGTIGAQANGDPEDGKKVFNQCIACHALEEGQHRVGPSLAGLWGREAGTAEGFDRYSDALKESGIVWDAETLDKYLADPAGYIPGNMMSFAGVKDEEAREDLIAFLKQETQ